MSALVISFEVNIFESNKLIIEKTDMASNIVPQSSGEFDPEGDPEL